MKKVVVISADYPGPDFIYGDVFVHTRVKRYRKYFDVQVIGFNTNLSTVRSYEYEDVNVYITYDLTDFYSKLKETNPDILVGHLIQHVYLNFLVSLNKPLVIFFHGFEVLSWRRRLMNYDSFGSLRYLIPYLVKNIKQRSALKKFVKLANRQSNIHFVFVSNWLRETAQRDLGKKIRNAHVIPNGIDTALFAYEPQRVEARKKVLLLRSFKAINYANDLAIEAIEILSKKDFFKELEFRIQGEGYLFPSLTEKLKRFENVTLVNSFIENKNIPFLHKQFGIFLCPSRLDTQGVSMCEAMASGLVPVTTPVGGIPEYNVDGVSGFQVSTAEEIAAKIEFLYNNPDAFLKMSREARSTIISKCSLDSTAQREVLLFQKLIDPSIKVSFEYKQCAKCILDIHDDPEITFDDAGVCSHCLEYELQESKVVKKGEEGERDLQRLVDEIKKSGTGKSYDCIIGLSGGVDSTYLAYQAKKLGLRPLAVHFDNGWNSELAVNNIENIINKLGFDLNTFVVDWEEFRDLQRSFLKASVIDIELITDHAIITKLYQLAIEHDVKYILSGSNTVTEFVLPSSWIHNKRDHVHIQAVHKQFGKIPIRTYPLFTSSLKWKVIWKNIKSVNLLDLMPYNKAEVKQIIAKELGWRDYGGKHYESVFTRFYQGYILPTKFGVDKRKAHLSNLICSGQITREEALLEFGKPAYEETQKRSDYEFVLKKLGLSHEEFNKMMNTPPKPHNDYPVEQSIYDRFPVLRVARPLWQTIKQLRKLT